MKTFFLILLFSLALDAQPVVTTLADTIYNSVTGTPFSGNVVIQGPNIIAPGNIPILGISRTVTISNGSLSIALVPNDTGSPASTYSLAFSNGDRKTCTVPTSPTPVTLAGAACVDGSQQVVPVVVSLTQLASGGAVAGQPLCFSGTSWAPGGVCGAPPITTITSAYTVTRNTGSIFCNATTGAVTVSLPSAAGSIPPAAGVWRGQVIILKKIDSTGNACAFAPTGGQTFDGASTLSITTQNTTYTIQGDGSNWQIIGRVP